LKETLFGLLEVFDVVSELLEVGGIDFESEDLFD